MTILGVPLSSGASTASEWLPSLAATVDSASVGLASLELALAQ